MVNTRGRNLSVLEALLSDARLFCLRSVGLPLFLAASFLLPHPAFASGYGVREWSAVAMGAAYAGASANGTDASFLAYNPATLAGVGSYDSTVSLTGLFPTSSATYTTATTSALTPTGGLMTPDEIIKNAFVPNLAARMRLSPEWALGLAVYAPWGLSTDYQEGWAGRYYALKSELLTVDVVPTVSYQVSDSFAVAAGLQFQYATGSLANAIDIGTIGALFSVPGAIPGAQDGDVVFDADGWGVGFVVGVMGELTEGVTVGLSYRSAVSHTLDGPLDFTLDSAGVGAAIAGVTGLFADTDAETTLTTPDRISAGVRFQLSEQWTAMGEIDFTNWSRFRELRVVPDNPLQPHDVTIAEWEDSWFGSIGLEYQADEQWTLRAGAGIDASPIPDATRNPRIPDADRTWISIGFTFQMTEALSLSASYAHLFLPDEPIALNQLQSGNALRGNIAGDGEANANFFGFQLSYRTN
jgi:long-chain fatty acid transport protein